jgi:hypothetical protein
MNGQKSILLKKEETRWVSGVDGRRKDGKLEFL